MAGDRVGAQQLRVIDEHALIVRLTPVAPGRVAKVATLDGVAEVARGQRAKGAVREGGCPCIPCSSATQQEQQGGRDREFRGAAEPAELRVLLLQKLVDGDGQLLSGRQRMRVTGRRPTDRLLQTLRTLQHLVPPLGPGLEHGLGHLAEARHPLLRQRNGRQIGGGVEGTPSGVAKTVRGQPSCSVKAPAAVK